jgi:hypothetical protein
MAEALMTGPVPLAVAPDGVMLRGTRVTLETVLAAFTEGATAEEIAWQYPSISLAHMYQVIGVFARRLAHFDRLGWPPPFPRNCDSTERSLPSRVRFAALY